MIWLALGVLVWSVVHLLRPLAPEWRSALIARLGADPYRGLFSMAIAASVVMMVIGWRRTDPTFVYAPPSWGADLALLLMLVAMILFAASGVPTNIKRFIRHPQLTGVAVWSTAHLLANGDGRSVVLFLGIGIWAVVEMIFINRREGAWNKPEPLPLNAEIKPLAGGLIVYALVFLAHPYLFGVSPR